MSSRPVFLTPHLDVTGGTERQVALLVRAFADRGIRVPVVTRRPEGTLPDLPAPIRTYHHPLHDLLRALRSLRPVRAGAPRVSGATPDDGAGTASARPNALRRWSDQALERRIAALAAPRDERPSVLHLHGTFSHVVCRGAARAAHDGRIPLVVKIANEPERVLAQLRLDARAFEAVRSASALVVVSEDARLHFEAAALGPRIVRVPNAVELPELRPRRSSAGALTFVGTLKPQKGLDVLLAAWARVDEALRREHPLRIVGDGPLRSDLEDRARRLGIAAQTVFAGASTDVRGELTASAAFVLPSRWEGMPNALLEAMAHALPCVATDIAGSRDLLAPSHAGWLVPPDDAAALALALEQALTDGSLAAERAQAARAYVRQHHAPERIVDLLLATYAQLGG